MKLNYKKYGETGENIIIIHGLFGMLDNWHTIAAKLGDEFQVYTVDLRNHGKSPHSKEFNYEILADDLNEFLACHQISKANIIGHSMGGKAAMQFAFDRPEKVNHLIVVDIAPKAYNPKHDRIIDALLSFDLNKVKNRIEADEMLSPQIPDFGERQFLLKSLTRDDGGFKWKFNLDSLTKNYPSINEAVEGQFDGPALFIKGSHSNYILKEDKPAILRQFPNARFITIEAGHWVHADNPEEFLKAVNNELS